MQPDLEWQTAARSGNTVVAIKLLRSSAGVELAEAKAAVEEWLRQNGPPSPVGENYYRICDRVDLRLKQCAETRSIPLCYLMHVLSPRETYTTTFDHIFTMVSRVADPWIDLAVEVVTADCSRVMFKNTIDEHLEAGAGMVWLIDAEDVSVRVATRNGPRMIYHDDAVFDGGDVLPGFACKVADLFA